MLPIRNSVKFLIGKPNVLSCTFCKRSTDAKTNKPKVLKRFYKNVTISQAEGGYEINLDKRKLKTPFGTLFKVPTEELALTVATEWDMQVDTIKKNTMHINALCNTAIDNPTHRDRTTVVNGILEFLATDTICYRVEEPEELAQQQVALWDPLLLWLKKRYNVDIEATTGLGVPAVPDETLSLFRKHLESFNDWALVGYEQSVESLKSLIIAFAMIDRQVTVEEAVKLSRLEMEFQIEKWGNVEWHHDVDLCELHSRTASSCLFVHLNSADTTTRVDKYSMKKPV